MPSDSIIDLTLSDGEDDHRNRPRFTAKKTMRPLMGHFAQSPLLDQRWPPAQSHGTAMAASGSTNIGVHASSDSTITSASGLYPQPTNRKRSAREAFGRNGVSELLDLAQANLQAGSAGLNLGDKSGSTRLDLEHDSGEQLLQRFSSPAWKPKAQKQTRSEIVYLPNGVQTTNDDKRTVPKDRNADLLQSSGRDNEPMYGQPYRHEESDAPKSHLADANHASQASQVPDQDFVEIKPLQTPEPAAAVVSPQKTSPWRIVQIRDKTPPKQSGPHVPVDIVESHPTRETVTAAPKQSNAPSGPVLASTARGIKFAQSALASRAGVPWTDAELLIAGYLYEVLKIPWTAVDKKMGRGYNTCATKFCRVPTGLKNAAAKQKMRWNDRIRAIEALISTLDPDMEQLVTHLQHYVDTDSLPNVAGHEFERLRSMQPESAVLVSKIQESITAVGPSRASPLSGSDALHPVSRTKSARRHPTEHAMVSNRLRPSARLADGELDVKAMIKPRDETPDSLIESSVESEDLPLLPDQKNINMFDIDVEAIEDDGLSGLYFQRKRPYLSRRERGATVRAIAEEPGAATQWQGATLHHGFTESEIDAIKEIISMIFPYLHQVSTCGTISEMLSHATTGQIVAIAAAARNDERLQNRTRRSIKSFLQDVSTDHIVLIPTRLRVGAKQVIPVDGTIKITRSLLRREFGLQNRSEDPKTQIRDNIYDTMTVVRTFTGASGDVGNVAWSPSGTHFVAGAVCLVDPSSMQYNRPNNLLFGDVEKDALYEIPDHHNLRTKPSEGVNATHSMHVSQDPRLFQTVSMVDFSVDGSYMYSVGYDNYLRAFHVDGKDGSCTLLDSFNHGAKIDLLSVRRQANLLATGAADTENGIKVFGCGPSGFRMLQNLYSPRARDMLDKKIMPSALKWGVHASASNYLMAGFSSNTGLDLNAAAAYGELCLWNVERNLPISVAPAAGNTFDCSWSPSSAWFATACAAYGTNLLRGTKSLVRVYNPVEEAGNLRWTTRGLQMDCPARDINDVLFNPYNQMHVAAGATDGSVYVWDLRNPDNLLHRLCHDESVMELDTNYAREVVDTGVRFCAWGHHTSRMYSGSSDGVLKVWDITRSTEDAPVRDVATFKSGIMSGAFTNDYSKLLIGEVNGSINLLEVGEEDTPSSKVEKFTLRSFEVAKEHFDTPAQDESGVAAARGLLADGRIEIRPLGGYPRAQAVQGSAYAGPFDTAADASNLRQRAHAFQEKMAISQRQCTLPQCRTSGQHFATDEIENSRRSMDRIPQALRDALRTEDDGGMPTTMLKCTHCGAAARVREDDMTQAVLPLCERCSFGCLRCGASNKISALVDTVSCSECGSSWDIGALGYLLKKNSSSFAEGTKKVAAAPLGGQRGILTDGGGLDDMGDLLHLVEDYHHSLWEDAPARVD